MTMRLVLSGIINMCLELRASFRDEAKALRNDTDLNWGDYNSPKRVNNEVND